MVVVALAGEYRCSGMVIEVHYFAVIPGNIGHKFSCCPDRAVAAAAQACTLAQMMVVSVIDCLGNGGCSGEWCSLWWSGGVSLAVSLGCCDIAGRSGVLCFLGACFFERTGEVNACVCRSVVEAF